MPRLALTEYQTYLTKMLSYWPRVSASVPNGAKFGAQLQAIQDELNAANLEISDLSTRLSVVQERRNMILARLRVLAPTMRGAAEVFAPDAGLRRHVPMLFASASRAQRKRAHKRKREQAAREAEAARLASVEVAPDESELDAERNRAMFEALV